MYSGDSDSSIVSTPPPGFENVAPGTYSCDKYSNNIYSNAENLTYKSYSIINTRYNLEEKMEDGLMEKEKDIGRIGKENEFGEVSKRKVKKGWAFLRRAKESTGEVLTAIGGWLQNIGKMFLETEEKQALTYPPPSVTSLEEKDVILKSMIQCEKEPNWMMEKGVIGTVENVVKNGFDSMNTSVSKNVVPHSEKDTLTFTILPREKEETSGQQDLDFFEVLDSYTTRKARIALSDKNPTKQSDGESSVAKKKRKRRTKKSKSSPRKLIETAGNERTEENSSKVDFDSENFENDMSTKVFSECGTDELNPLLASDSAGARSVRMPPKKVENADDKKKLLKPDKKEQEKPDQPAHGKGPSKKNRSLIIAAIRMLFQNIRGRKVLLNSHRKERKPMCNVLYGLFERLQTNVNYHIKESEVVDFDIKEDEYKTYANLVTLFMNDINFTVPEKDPERTQFETEYLNPFLESIQPDSSEFPVLSVHNSKWMIDTEYQKDLFMCKFGSAIVKRAKDDYAFVRRCDANKFMAIANDGFLEMNLATAQNFVNSGCALVQLQMVREIISPEVVRALHSHRIRPVRYLNSWGICAAISVTNALNCLPDKIKQLLMQLQNVAPGEVTREEYGLTILSDLLATGIEDGESQSKIDWKMSTKYPTDILFKLFTIGLLNVIDVNRDIRFDVPSTNGMNQQNMITKLFKSIWEREQFRRDILFAWKLPEIEKFSNEDRLCVLVVPNQVIDESPCLVGTTLERLNAMKLLIIVVDLPNHSYLVVKLADGTLLRMDDDTFTKIKELNVEEKKYKAAAIFSLSAKGYERFRTKERIEIMSKNGSCYYVHRTKLENHLLIWNETHDKAFSVKPPKYEKMETKGKVLRCFRADTPSCRSPNITIDPSALNAESFNMFANAHSTCVMRCDDTRRGANYAIGGVKFKELAKEFEDWVKKKATGNAVK